ncbi:hypothetical protein Cci01nite_16770 [Catellatospora citrea]|uniref:Uncharacterized protein n=1 Tax=Catellatospora citrea TaxID=53366 RepID=A0A8J3NY25_9ACTN|nr:hypothetical protein Cci01nite_16770 [Catellatospora citrea]
MPAEPLVGVDALTGDADLDPTTSYLLAQSTDVIGPIRIADLSASWSDGYGNRNRAAALLKPSAAAG